ncbi:MAG TPA: entericidin A/B family lipoprotein [Burkholderiales bacterium]|nr:entericidin A/B family lipoprotein [Burkholderiales bacterium]
MRKSLCFLLTMIAFMSGCNTVEGFGRDVEKVGDKIEKAAK